MVIADSEFSKICIYSKKCLMIRCLSESIFLACFLIEEPGVTLFLHLDLFGFPARTA